MLGTPFWGGFLSHLQQEAADWTFPQGFQELVLLAWLLSRCHCVCPRDMLEGPVARRSPQVLSELAQSDFWKNQNVTETYSFSSVYECLPHRLQ